MGKEDQGIKVGAAAGLHYGPGRPEHWSMSIWVRAGLDGEGARQAGQLHNTTGEATIPMTKTHAGADFEKLLAPGLCQQSAIAEHNITKQCKIEVGIVTKQQKLIPDG